MKYNKIKKFMTIILSLVMTLMLVPSAVKAADLTVGTGGTYATLGAALSAAADGDTITLLSNVIETTDAAFDTTGKTITINGGSHNVTGKSSVTGSSYGLKVTGSGSLILKDIEFIGGSAGSEDTDTYVSAGLWTDLSGNGHVYTMGNVTATGGYIAVADSFIDSIGLYNTGSGTVDINYAVGGNTDLTTLGEIGRHSSYGIYNTGSGTLNVWSAGGGVLLNPDSSGSTTDGAVSTQGTVNIAIASGGSTIGGSGYSNGIFNSGTGNANIMYSYAGEASVMSTSATNNFGTGTTNVSRIFLSSTSFIKYSVVNVNGVINAGTIADLGDTMGDYNIDATATLNLDANGGECVLSSITVAKTGTTNIGTLPGVFKDGVKGNWYTDSELSTLFTGTTVSGETTLYAGGWSSDPVSITSLPESYSMDSGGKVVFNPQPSGGTWEWDHSFFSATFNSPATFTALKSGTSTITYTINGVSHEITVTVKAPTTAPATAPATGENMTMIYTMAIIAVISFMSIVFTVSRKVKTKA